ncbi:unnamed protein product [Lampetra planeri]
MEVVEEGGEEENAAGRTRLKRFYFADEEDDDDDAALLVTIPESKEREGKREHEDADRAGRAGDMEVLDPHYGMYVWPCSVVLAQFVWHNRALVRDQLVLELGAGTALPGIVAARCGATVTLSDLPRCLPSCAHSCRVNGLDGSVPVLGLRWGLVTPSLVTMPPLDIILGSDILYEPRDFEAVLVTVSYLLNKNPHGQFWTTYQERSAEWSLEPLLLKWGLWCRLVEPAAFRGDSPTLAGSSLPGDHTVHMCIITRVITHDTTQRDLAWSSNRR